jgi:hypothetical protein
LQHLLANARVSTQVMNVFSLAKAVAKGDQQVLAFSAVRPIDSKSNEPEDQSRPIHAKTNELDGQSFVPSEVGVGGGTGAAVKIEEMDVDLDLDADSDDSANAVAALLDLTNALGMP